MNLQTVSSNNFIIISMHNSGERIVESVWVQSDFEVEDVIYISQDRENLRSDWRVVVFCRLCKQIMTSASTSRQKKQTRTERMNILCAKLVDSLGHVLMIQDCNIRSPQHSLRIKQHMSYLQ